MPRTRSMVKATININWTSDNDFELVSDNANTLPESISSEISINSPGTSRSGSRNDGRGSRTSGINLAGGSNTNSEFIHVSDNINDSVVVLDIDEINDDVTAPLDDDVGRVARNDINEDVTIDLEDTFIENLNNNQSNSDVIDLTDDRVATERAQLLDPITLMSPTNKSPPRVPLHEIVDLTNSPAPSASQSGTSSPTKTSSKPSCSICLETFKDLKKAGEDIVSTTCGHVFCHTCLSSSLSTNGKKCPVCRKMLTSKNHWHKIFI